MNESYPKNWKHCMIHLNPETGKMHSDGDHSVRTWIEQRISHPDITEQKLAKLEQENRKLKKEIIDYRDKDDGYNLN